MNKRHCGESECRKRVQGKQETKETKRKQRSASPTIRFSRNSLGIITLQAVTALGLLPHDIENRVDQLRTFGIVTFGPVVSSSALPEHEVIRPKDLPVWPGSHAIHGTGLQIHEHSTGDIPPTAGLIVVHIHALELKIGNSLIRSGGIDAVLLTHDLPELGTDLVPALPSLDVQNLTHIDRCSRFRNKKERMNEETAEPEPEADERGGNTDKKREKRRATTEGTSDGGEEKRDGVQEEESDGG